MRDTIVKYVHSMRNCVQSFESRDQSESWMQHTTDITNHRSIGSVVEP